MKPAARLVPPVDAGVVDVRAMVVRDEDGFPFSLAVVGEAADQRPLGRLNQLLGVALRMFTPTADVPAGPRRFPLPWSKASGLPTLH